MTFDEVLVAAFGGAWLAARVVRWRRARARRRGRLQLPNLNN